jgi:hypothetical protein
MQNWLTATFFDRLSQKNHALAKAGIQYLVAPFGDDAAPPPNSRGGDTMSGNKSEAKARPQLASLPPMG